MKKRAVNRILDGQPDAPNPLLKRSIRMDMNSDALKLPVFFPNEDFDTHFKVFHELMSNKVFDTTDPELFDTFSS